MAISPPLFSRKIRSHLRLPYARSLRITLAKLHRLTTKRAHLLLLSKFEFYARWWAWQYHKHVHIASAVVAVLLGGVVLFSQAQNALALSMWTQSDRSGGVGASTSNQYSAGTNVNTATANQISLATVSSNWYNPSWSFRQPITINHADVTSNQTNFPVLISISSDSNLASNAQSSGNDILFTSSDGTTKLSHEIEKYDSSTGQLTAWLKVPSLSSTADTVLYMYYGNSGASNQQDKTGVWSNGYVSVWHLQEASGSNSDSTVNANNTTVSGTTSTAGEILNGRSFSGSDYEYGSLTNWFGGNNTLTAEAWYNVTASSNGPIFGVTASPPGGGWDMPFLSANGTTIYGWLWEVNGNSPLSYTTTTGWHHLVMTYDPSVSGTESLYIDGTLVKTGTGQYSPSGGTDYWTTNINGAKPSGVSSYLNGALDEIRASNVARSASWIKTEYNNENSPSTFESLGSEQTIYATTASITSNIFNTDLPEDWATLTYSDTVPSGTTVSVQVRAGNQPNLSDTPAFTSCSSIASGGAITSTCAPNKSQYVQYQLSFTSNGTNTPIFTSVNLNYSPSDTIPPTTNASSVQMYKNNGGASVVSNGWVNSNPYFTWTAGVDNSGGSGMKGYCLYLGQDPTGNPITTKGNLGTSPLGTGGACQFAVSSTNVDLSLSGYIGTALTSSNLPYYLNVVAIDNANNVYTGSPAQFQFRFDNTAPTNPAFVSAPSQFVSSKVVDLTWPTTGSNAAADSNSGVAGLQYKIGSNGVWYGANHSGTQDSTDLLPNNGTYTTINSPDFTSLQEGDNIVYFRTYDYAGNISPAYVTAVIKINTTSPSSPQNLTATPSINTVNSFSFSWLPPATFLGSAANMTYCYTVNTLPNSNNCTFTPAAATSLSAGSYATQPGMNTLYVVAKDEAGNINYDTAANANFTANTPAPGIPLSMDIADISIKASSIWKLALSWEPPSTVGSGIATYRVYRSTNGVSYTQIASTAGASYVDTGLNQQTYYYKVEACDSANNCGVFTSPVTMYPTGKFTSPANLISGPTVTATTRSATISWTTDRASDSQVEYGISSGNYFQTAASNVEQTTSHQILLNNLDAGTTYYYRALWTDTDGNTGLSVEGKFTTLPAPTISNVTVTNINLYNATINFTTDGASSVKLYYGPNGSLGNTQILNTSSTTSTYAMPLKNLTDGVIYTYRIDPFDVSGYEYTNPTSLSFTTPPAPRITNVAFQPVPGALTGTEQVSWTTNVPTTTQISYALQGSSMAAGTQAINTEMSTSHTMTISDLRYNTPYQLIATSQDTLGNIVTSDLQVFHTGLDTRPPTVSSVVVQPSIHGTGASASGQIVVSWKTDKAGTSQVSYGEGSSGSYTSKTAEDMSMVTNHVLVISNLPTSQVFHLQALSRDEAGNVGVSENQTTIVGQATDSALSIIFNSLRAVFGL